MSINLEKDNNKQCKMKGGGIFKFLRFFLASLDDFGIFTKDFFSIKIQNITLNQPTLLHPQNATRHNYPNS